jgi:hypothetical protein
MQEEGNMETTLCRVDEAPVTPRPRAKPGPKAPSRWTAEVVEEMAGRLVAYFEKPDALFLESWCAEEGIPIEYPSRLAARNEAFADAMAVVAAVQCSRLLEGGIHGRLNSKICALVLTARFQFVTKSDLTLRTPEETADERIRHQAETLMRLLPQDPTEARLKLEEFRQSDDEIVIAAVDHAEQLLTMLEQTKSLGSAVVNG